MKRDILSYRKTGFEDIGRDPLRIIFYFLFSLKRDENESISLRSVTTKWVNEHHWMDESASVEAVTWAQVRSVCREWNEVADSMFDVFSHPVIFCIAVMTDRRQCFDLLMDREPLMRYYIFPALSACMNRNKKSGIAYLSLLLEKFPDLWNELVNLFDGDDLDHLLVDSDEAYLNFAQLQENMKENLSKFKNSVIPCLRDTMLARMIAKDKRTPTKFLNAFILYSIFMNDESLFGDLISHPNASFPIFWVQWMWPEGMKVLVKDPKTRRREIQLFLSVLNSPECAKLAEAWIDGGLSPSEFNFFLHHCVMSENTEVFKVAMKNISEKDHAKLTCFLCLAPNADINGTFLRIALEKEFSINDVPFFTAICQGNIPHLRLLLEKYPQRFKDMKGVLLSAVRFGQLPSVVFLLENHIPQEEDIQEALLGCWLLKSEEFSNVIFQHGVKFCERMADTAANAPPNQFKKFLEDVNLDYYNSNILVSCVFSGSLDNLKTMISFLEKSKDQHSDDENASLGCDALVEAVSVGRLDMVKELLQFTDKKVLNSRKSPILHISRMKGFKQIEEFLIKSGAKEQQIFENLFHADEKRRRMCLKEWQWREMETEIDTSIASTLLQFNVFGLGEEQIEGLGPLTATKLFYILMEEDKSITSMNWLVDLVDFTYNDQIIFLKAIQMQDAELVRFLLKNPQIDPSLNESEALSLAVSSGGIEIVKMLLNDGRAKLEESGAFIWTVTLEDPYLFNYLLDNPKSNIERFGSLAFILSHDKEKSRMLYQRIGHQLREPGFFKVDGVADKGFEFLWKYIQKRNSNGPKEERSDWLIPSLSLACGVLIMSAFALYKWRSNRA